MSKIHDIEDLKSVLLKEEQELDAVYLYLNDAGKGKLEALRAIYFHVTFAESLTELITSKDYLALVDIEGKHPEYYATLNMVNKAIKNIVY